MIRENPPRKPLIRRMEDANDKNDKSRSLEIIQSKFSFLMCTSGVFYKCKTNDTTRKIRPQPLTRLSPCSYHIALENQLLKIHKCAHTLTAHTGCRPSNSHHTGCFHRHLLCAPFDSSMQALSHCFWCSFSLVSRVLGSSQVCSCCEWYTGRIFLSGWGLNVLNGLWLSRFLCCVLHLCAAWSHPGLINYLSQKLQKSPSSSRQAAFLFNWITLTLNRWQIKKFYKQK